MGADHRRAAGSSGPGGDAARHVGIPVRTRPAEPANQGEGPFHAVHYEDLIVNGSTARYAIVSTITDNFIGLGAAYLYSLHNKLKKRNEYDIILMADKNAAPLSEKNRELLRKIHPRLIVLDIDTSKFLNDETTKRYDKDGNLVRQNIDARVPNKKAVYLKLCVLRLSQYEKVLLMDSDLLILDDFGELFDLPGDVVCARAGPQARDNTVRFSPRGEKGPMFNSGVVMFSKAVRGGKWFDQAVELVLAKANTPLQDQSIFNALLLKRSVLYLPQIYNFKLNFRKKDFLAKGEPLRIAKILHFIGPGKWALKEPERAGEKIYDYFHEVQAKTGVPFILG